MKQTLLVLLIFSLMVASAAAAYKYASPYIDFESSGVDFQLLRSGGLFVSINGGDSWIEADIRGGKSSNMLVNDLEYYSKDGSINFLIGALNGVYHSQDNGLTWERVFTRSIRREVLDIAVDDTDLPAILYIATKDDDGNGIITKSVDGGVSFDTVFTLARRGEQIVGVAVDKNSRRNVYGLTNRGSFLKSSDFGKSWRKVEISSLKFEKLVLDDKNPSVVYAITKDIAFFKSTNGGSTWKDMRESISRFTGAFSINDFSISPLASTTVYLGTNFGILKSSNGGTTFRELPFLLPSNTIPITAIGADSAKSSVLFAGVKNQIYKTRDSGTSWQISELETSGTINYIFVNPNDSQIIYAGIKGGL